MGTPRFAREGENMMQNPVRGEEEKKTKTVCTITGLGEQ